MVIRKCESASFKRFAVPFNCGDRVAQQSQGRPERIPDGINLGRFLTPDSSEIGHVIAEQLRCLNHLGWRVLLGFENPCQIRDDEQILTLIEPWNLANPFAAIAQHALGFGPLPPVHQNDSQVILGRNGLRVVRAEQP